MTVVCYRCLKVSKKEDLRQHAKKRKKIIKNLKQCDCGSVVFFSK